MTYDDAFAEFSADPPASKAAATGWTYYE